MHKGGAANIWERKTGKFVKSINQLLPGKYVKVKNILQENDHTLICSVKKWDIKMRKDVQLFLHLESAVLPLTSYL